MIRKYPVEKPVSVPATGSRLYRHMLDTVKIPARANHEIWYLGEKNKLELPEEHAFRGGIPKGRTLELVTLSGSPIDKAPNASESKEGFDYTFLGSEGPVYVKDLAESAKTYLAIPKKVSEKDKVFNPNFKPYEELDAFIKMSNELASLSFPKSFSSYLLGSGKMLYSEKDVLEFIEACFNDLSSEEMLHVLHGNHLAWASLAYVRSNGKVEEDVCREFFAQNPADFYMKDVGTVLPAMFYSLAILGEDPAEYCNNIDFEIWGAKESAKYMRQYMNPNAAKIAVTS